MSYPETVLSALEQHGRRMVGLTRDGLAGALSDLEVRNLVADTARSLASTIDELYLEQYPPEAVPAEGVGIGPGSPLSEVVAWTEQRGLAPYAKVVRSWLWLEGQSAVPESMVLVARAAGFRYSPKRRGWFHTCGVEPKGGSVKPLSQGHGVSSVETFKAGNHKADPAWLVKKQAKAKRSAALKANGPVPAYGA